MIGTALVASLLMFQGTGGFPPLPRGAMDPTAPAVLVQRAANAERAFLTEWNNAWRASERIRAAKEGARRGAHLKLPWLDIRFEPRQADISCAPSGGGNVGTYLPDHSWGIDPRFRRIPSANGTLGVCPNWLPPGDTSFVGPDVVPDERLGIDGALDSTVLNAIRSARGDVIALLDSVVTAVPENNAVVGQFVRLLIDQRELSRAESVARRCKAEDWWCNALLGYVLSVRGNARGAEAAYTRSVSQMYDEERCAWTDVSALLDSAARVAYRAKPCAERDAFNTRFWWLSDPLWSVPGNDRLAEHFTRNVLITLHGSTGRDERYDWTPAFGGDALAELVIRYGWPSYTFFGTSVKEGIPGGGPMGNTVPFVGATTRSGLPDSAVNRVGGVRGTRGLGPESMSVESMYARMRADFLGDCMPTRPPMCTGMDIGSDVTAPVAGDPAHPKQPPAPAPAGTQFAKNIGTDLEYSLDRVHPVPTWNALKEPFAASLADWSVNAPHDTVERRNWWPHEHYHPALPIVQFTDFQWALFRRDRGPMFAFSTNLALTDLARLPDDSVSTRLMLSLEAGTVLPFASGRARATDRAVFFKSMPDSPALVSVEVPWDTAQKPGARARFAITPPAPLSRMKKGETAISDPVLLIAPANGAALPNDATAAIPFMLGGTTLANGTKTVGVYWETYGYAATDTVDVSLRVQRQTPLTVLEQVASVAGIGGNTPLTFSWREPAPGHDARTVRASVPIQMRSVALEISALRPGAYMLEVAVGKPGQTPLRSQRAFVIR